MIMQRLWAKMIAVVALVGLLALATHSFRTAHQAGSEAAALALQLNETRAELTRAKARAELLAAKAAELDNELGSAKTRTTATETKSSQINRELSVVKETLAERQQREVALLAEIESLRQQARATEVASVLVPVASAPQPKALEPGTTYPLPAMEAESAPPVDFSSFTNRIAALEAQLTEMLTRALAVPVETGVPAGPAPPAPVVHQVVRVGAKEAFVVLDYGSEHGATIGEFASLSRGTSELARVQISDVRPRFSIAQVLPQMRNGQLQAGDIVVIPN